MNADQAANAIAYVANADTILIVTERTDGTEIVTPIMGVVVDRVPYIRNGFGSKWFLRAIRTGRLALVDGGDRYPASIEHVHDEELLRAVDGAYETKYAGDNRALEHAVSSDGRRHTLRVKIDASPD